MSDAQQFLKNQITEQSEGRIKQVDFRSGSQVPIATTVTGHKAYWLPYSAEIDFTEACLWASAIEPEEASFKTFAAGKAKPGVGKVFEISKPGDRFTIQGRIFFKEIGGRWTLTNIWSENPLRTSDFLDRQACMMNLKQISIAFRHWAGEHKGQFSFNVSTNAGGSAELSSPGPDGFEKNALSHLLVVTEGLYTPGRLICPADHSKRAASDFQNLQSSNVSYELRCGTNHPDDFPSGILARCPIHGHILYMDGTIVVGNKVQSK